MQDPQIVHRHGHSVLIDREGVARQGARIDKRGEGSASIYSYLCDGAASGEPGVAIFVMCNDRALVRRAVWQLHGGAPIRGHRIQIAPAIPQKHLIGVEVQSGRHAFKLLPVGREMRLNQLAHGGDGRGVAPAHHVFPCFGVQKVFVHRVGAETVENVGGHDHVADRLAHLLAVGVEDPGYPDARNIFDARRAFIQRLAVDDRGLVLDARAEAVLRKTTLVCVTPAHHCPTMVSLRDDRREKLLELADREDFLIIEDDYEGEIRSEQTPPALKSIDRSGRVLYVGTMSKVLAPGVRIGYIVGGAELIAEARALGIGILAEQAGE